MTTICCTRTEMAADSRASDDTSFFEFTKVHRAGDWIFGTAGSLVHCAHIAEYLRAASKRNVNPLTALRELAELKEEDQILSADETELLLLAKSGIYGYEGMGVPFRYEGRKYAAIGTGRQGAEALLRVGYTPGEAIAVMKKIDMNTGGRVKTLKLAKPKRKKR